MERKGSFKGNKVECFNCRGVGHYSQDCPSPNDIKNSMQATWSDSNSVESASIISKDARYDLNDMLAFVASMEPVNNSDCDSDDDEFTDEQREFLDNHFLSMKG